MSKQETPGVIAPPPLIYLAAALVIGLGLGYLAPTPFLPRSRAYGLGVVLILIAAWIVIPARRMMHRAGTVINPTIPTTALVITDHFVSPAIRCTSALLSFTWVSRRRPIALGACSVARCAGRDATRGN
jgi:hypothetical protein